MTDALGEIFLRLARLHCFGPVVRIAQSTDQSWIRLRFCITSYNACFDAPALALEISFESAQPFVQALRLKTKCLSDSFGFEVNIESRFRYCDTTDERSSPFDSSRSNVPGQFANRS